MNRYLILIALLMCLPVRVEAWQVVGGGTEGGTEVRISDLFTVDTSANYTKVRGTGTLAIVTTPDSYAHVSTTYQGRNIWRHNTTLGSADQHIWGTIDNAAESGGLAFRINPTNQTCYVAYFTSAGALCIRGFDLAAGAWGTTVLASGTTYTTGPRLVDITITGTAIVAKVDGATAISSTSSEFATGDYAGILIYRDSDDAKIYDFGAE